MHEIPWLHRHPTEEEKQRKIGERAAADGSFYAGRDGFVKILGLSANERKLFGAQLAHSIERSRIYADNVDLRAWIDDTTLTRGVTRWIAKKDIAHKERKIAKSNMLVDALETYTMPEIISQMSQAEQERSAIVKLAANDAGVMFYHVDTVTGELQQPRIVSNIENWAKKWEKDLQR